MTLAKVMRDEIFALLLHFLRHKNITANKKDRNAVNANKRKSETLMLPLQPRSNNEKTKATTISIIDIFNVLFIDLIVNIIILTYFTAFQVTPLFQIIKNTHKKSAEQLVYSCPKVFGVT